MYWKKKKRNRISRIRKWKKKKKSWEVDPCHRKTAKSVSYKFCLRPQRHGVINGNDYSCKKSWLADGALQAIRIEQFDANILKHRSSWKGMELQADWNRLEPNSSLWSQYNVWFHFRRFFGFIQLKFEVLQEDGQSSSHLMHCKILSDAVSAKKKKQITQSTSRKHCTNVVLWQKWGYIKTFC